GARAPSGPPRWLLPLAVVVLFLLLGGGLSGPGGRLAEVQRNDSTAYLPHGTESVAALNAEKKFTGLETTPAILVYTRPSALTDDDKVQLTLLGLAIVEQLNQHLAAPPIGPIVSDDGRSAQMIVELIGSDPNLLRDDVHWLRQRGATYSGVDVHVGGPAAALVDLTEVFGEVDGVLLGVTLLLVLLILVVVYRSPILPFVVLGVAGIALGLANGTVYLLAKANVLTVSGDAQGILDVLVLGAGTDYALLLVARYREELRRHEDRHEAMAVALHRAGPAILASAGTVIAGMGCLLAADSADISGLGPVAAIGIAVSLLAMITLLPALLVIFGRWMFWPLRPAFGSPEPATRGFWARVGRAIGVRPRVVWITTALVLGAMAVGLAGLKASGVSNAGSFRV